MYSNFEFQANTKIILGKNTLEKLPVELDLLQVTSPFIITEENLVKIGTLGIVETILSASGLPVPPVFEQVPPDSDLEVVSKIVSACMEKKCDGIVALGGGSVIDTAKAVAVSLSYGFHHIENLAGSELISRNMKPLIIIPTTSGTGSEVTGVAVINNAKDHVKMTFNSYKLCPHTAILDPAMTQTLPGKLTVTTGIDALTHAIEASSCVQRNPLSDAYAATAIRLISRNIETALSQPKNTEARMNMALASTCAGIAFSNSMVGLVHAIGHALGGEARIPHGLAMMIMLTTCMKFNYEKALQAKNKPHEKDISAKSMYNIVLKNMIEDNDYCAINHEKRGYYAIEAVEKLLVKLAEKADIPLRLSEFGVKKNQLDAIRIKALNDGSLIYNNVKTTSEEIAQLLESVY